MESNGRPVPPPELPPAPARVGRRVLVVTLLLLLLPVTAAVVVFPALYGGPFPSPDEIDPATLKSFKVQVLNRAELDGGEDIFRFTADPADYPALLAPLKGATAVDRFPDARGPWLAEYQLRTRTGQNETVKLYWHRRPQDPPNAPARLRFEMADKWYEAGPAMAVVAAAEAAAKRVGP